MISFFDVAGQLDEAEVVVVGFPLEVTVPRPGTGQGPESIRAASAWLEYYSPRLKRDINELTICDLGDMEDCNFTDIKPGAIGDREIGAQLKRIESQILGLTKKKIVGLGGEHTISLPIVQALACVYPELRVLQIDAHADLRNTYEGKMFHHATVMRRIAELLGNDRVFQLGVRSGEKEELEFGRTRLLSDICLSKETLDELRPYPIYLTIDIDILDPAYGPGVGVPEPAGINTQMLLEIIYSLHPLNIVGFDLVEVSPPYDPGAITSAAAAKIIREAILSFW